MRRNIQSLSDLLLFYLLLMLFLSNHCCIHATLNTSWSANRLFFFTFLKNQQHKKYSGGGGGSCCSSSRHNRHDHCSNSSFQQMTKLQQQQQQQQQTRQLKSTPTAIPNCDNSIGSSQEEADAETILRVLCLHGKYDNAESMETFLTPLREELEAKLSGLLPNPKHVQFDYLNAPFIIGQEKGNKDAIIGNSSSCSSSRTVKREWWTLPPGVRSFDATEYGGYQQSADLVQKALMGQDYDLILCHSQGSILMASLLCNPLWTSRVFGGNTSSSTSTSSSSSNNKKPKGYILNGCAWPKPYGELLENFYKSDAVSCLGMMDHGSAPPPKVLFVMAKDDPVNPTKGAERVRDCFLKASTTTTTTLASAVEGVEGVEGEEKTGLIVVDSYYHDGDHSLPVNDKDAIKYILNWIMDIFVQTSI